MTYTGMLAQVDGKVYRLVSGGIDSASLREKLGHEGYGHKWIDAFFTQLEKEIEEKINAHLDKGLAQELSRSI